MRLLAFICIYVISTPVFGQSQADLRRQITELKATQRAEYETVLKDLKGSRDYATSLYTDLEKAQTQLNAVGTERDGWRDYGNDQHEKFINAEKRVSDEKVKKQRWFMLFSGLAILVAAYFGLKFFTPIGRLIP